MVRAKIKDSSDFRPGEGAVLWVRKSCGRAEKDLHDDKERGNKMDSLPESGANKPETGVVKDRVMIRFSGFFLLSEKYCDWIFFCK
jgi:hypothetical protein